MDAYKQHHDNVEDFVTLLYSKGFRGRYTISGYGGRPKHTGQLLELLKEYVNHFATSSEPPRKCTLTTGQGDISYLFVISYDKAMGFRVNSLTATQVQTNVKRTFNLHSNYQLPAAKTVSAMFPFPKLGERRRNGKGGLR